MDPIVRANRPSLAPSNPNPASPPARGARRRARLAAGVPGVALFVLTGCGPTGTRVRPELVGELPRHERGDPGVGREPRAAQGELGGQEE